MSTRNEKVNQTQRDQVQKHLNRGWKITSWRAIEKYKITRLAEVIRVLEDERGMRISHTRMVNPKTGRQYVEYRKVKSKKKKK